MIPAAILISDFGLGHARLRVETADNNIPKLTARNASDANKGGATQADLPCGRNSLVRDKNPVVLIAGETIVADIEETINHNGRYEINFSPDGTNGFLENNLVSVVDNQAGAPNKANPNRYQATFDVPTTPCTDCTLQMVQVMVGANNVETYYKSCVDIIITPAANPPPPKPAGLTVEVK